MNPQSIQWSARADEPGKLNVLSAFFTIDGEANGFHVGGWSVFVRLTGCRVGCHWCDTKYSWSIKQGHLLTPRELFHVVRVLSKGIAKISITGGEPLEQDGPAFREFVNMALDHGHKISIETSGTEDIVPLLDSLRYPSYRKSISLVVDWKLPSAKAVKPPLESNFNSLRKHDVIKFVVANDEDIEEMLRVVRKLNWTYAQMVASPARSNMTPYYLVEKIRYFPEQFARSVGINLQMHKYIWDVNHRDEEEGDDWVGILNEIRQEQLNKDKEREKEQSNV